MFLGALVIGLFVGYTVPASSHAGSTYYTKTWGSDINLAFGYQSGSLGSTTARATYNRADSVWNNVTGVTVDFYNSGSVNPMVYDTGSVCDVPASRVWIVSNDISGGGLARAATCGSNPTRGIVVIDSSSRTWEYGSDFPTSTEWDLQGVVTHEYGHVTGFSGHFPSADCPNTALQTMCPTLPSAGVYQWRTLGSHDIHTMQNAY